MHTGCDVEGFNHIEENEKTQREVDDGHEEQKSTCPVVVGTDVGGNCIGKNLLNFFFKRWDKLKPTRDCFFDEVSDKLLRSLQKSDGFYGALPPYAQEIFEVSVICVCKTTLIKNKLYRSIDS